MKIKELTEGERPRERMMEYGAESLGTGELLAILLRSGTRGESAVDLAQRMLALAGGSLVQLSRIPVDRLRAQRGLGGTKVLPVIAALELGRRFMAEESRLEKIPVIAPAQVYIMMKPELKGLETEECWVIYLNAAKYVISKEGNPRPGSEDIRQTAALRAALKPFSIELVDHVVFADDSYYSFADETVYRG